MTDPTTLAAIAESIAETLEYFDTEFSNTPREKVDSWHVHEHSVGVTVGQLRALHAMLTTGDSATKMDFDSSKKALLWAISVLEVNGYGGTADKLRAFIRQDGLEVTPFPCALADFNSLIGGEIKLEDMPVDSIDAIRTALHPCGIKGCSSCGVRIK